MSLFQERLAFKPFQYPWCYQAWEHQQKIHWLPEEVVMADDIKDWNFKLSTSEKNLVSNILRLFTQSDVEISKSYHTVYLSRFKPVEVQMMLMAFQNMETIHAVAYSHLIDTLGLPESEYSAFMNYREMKEKWESWQNFFDPKTIEDLAVSMAVFGAFTEGLQLFASFAMLLNFPRFNKLKGVGQIITWSVRDETLHCESVIRLFREMLKEHPEINTPHLEARIKDQAVHAVSHEDAFIDKAFELGGVEGMTADDIKAYIRYIANRRLEQLGYEGIFNVTENPLPWLDHMLNAVEHANFFEQRATEYSKASTSGTWDDVWAKPTYTVYGKINCPNCDTAEKLLKSKGIEYKKVDVSDDFTRELIYAKTGLKSVPVVMYGDTLVGGLRELLAHISSP